MKAQLCKCTNCGEIMIDRSKLNILESPIPDNGYEMELLPDHVLEMELLDDGEYYYLACPVCLTDAYLIDITE